MTYKNITGINIPHTYKYTLTEDRNGNIKRYGKCYTAKPKEVFDTSKVDSLRFKMKTLENLLEYQEEGTEGHKELLFKLEKAREEYQNELATVKAAQVDEINRMISNKQ